MSSKRKILDLESEQKVLKENKKSVRKKQPVEESYVEEEDEDDEEEEEEEEDSDYEEENECSEEDEENKVTNDEYYDVSKVNIEEILSTSDIANKLKRLLARDRIKHEIFSKSILGCSKSTLARLLYEPKTWETINDMWKLYFKIIHLWLNDKKRLDKLKYNKKLPLTVKIEASDSSPPHEQSEHTSSPKSKVPRTAAAAGESSSPVMEQNDNEFDIIETFRSNKHS